MKQKQNIFSETNLIFKRHWWKFLALDTIFLAAAFFFFVYARERIKMYFAIISQYAGQIAGAQALVQQNSAESMAQIGDLLGILNPLAKQVYFFAFFIVPVVIIVLWCLFEAPNYSLITRNRLLSATNYIRFIVFSVPLYALGLFILNKMFDQLYTFSLAAVKTLEFNILLVCLLAVFYITQILYSFTMQEKYRQMMSSMSCVLKKTHKMLPAFILYWFFTVIVLGAMVNLFLKWIAGNNAAIALAVVYVIIPLLGIGWSRALFALKAIKCSLL